MVVFSQRPLSFKDLDGDSFLVVLISSEDLRFLSRDVWSFRDNLAHNTTDGFNTKWKRSSINNDEISSSTVLSTDNTTLNSSTIADSLIRVDTSVGLFSIEELLNKLSNFRNSSRSTDQNDFVDFVLFQASTFKGEFKRLKGLFEEITVNFFEFGSRKALWEVKSFN